MLQHVADVRMLSGGPICSALPTSTAPLAPASPAPRSGKLVRLSRQPHRPRLPASPVTYPAQWALASSFLCMDSRCKRGGDRNASPCSHTSNTTLCHPSLQCHVPGLWHLCGLRCGLQVCAHVRRHRLHFWRWRLPGWQILQCRQDMPQLPNLCGWLLLQRWRRVCSVRHRRLPLVRLRLGCLPF